MKIFHPYNPSTERRVVVTNHINPISRTHSVLKRGTESGRTYLKIGKGEFVEYPSVLAALHSDAMLEAELPF